MGIGKERQVSHVVAYSKSGATYPCRREHADSHEAALQAQSLALSLFTQKAPRAIPTIHNKFARSPSKPFPGVLQRLPLTFGWLSTSLKGAAGAGVHTPGKSTTRPPRSPRANHLADLGAHNMKLVFQEFIRSQLTIRMPCFRGVHVCFTS